MQSLTRNFLLTLTIALPAGLTACGDNGGGTTAGASTGGSTGGEPTGGGDTTGTPTTGGGDTTTGMSAGQTTTGDPATTEPPTTGDPSTTTGPDLTTTTDVTATTTGDTTGPGTTTGNETGDPVQQCIMMLPDPNDACGQCACTNCTMELAECQADEGCTAIRMCAQENMCGGIDCLGPCGDTIDMYGGLGGPSAQKGLALSGCIADNCEAECG